jgi:nucleoside-diphosphate-sugar epimerase
MPSDSPNPRFVLTGPTGWIGEAMLSHIEGQYGSAVAGAAHLFGSNARHLNTPSGGKLAVRRLSDITPSDVEGAHVIHLAYLTKGKALAIGERAFTETNIGIDDALLSALHQAKPASLFVASSGAAALAASGDDLHPYGLAKLRQEARFLEWGAASSVPVLAGRIFNIAGPHINKLEAYAISNFAQQALRTGYVEISAHVPVFRSFLHVGDLCALAIQAGLSGMGRERPLDLCGTEILEMGEIAQLVVELCGNGAIIKRGPVDHSRPSEYLGRGQDTRVFAMQQGRLLAPVRQQISDTIDWMNRTSGQC